MEVTMQSAGQTRGATERSTRTPAVNRTLVWFGEAAEQRRRRSLPAAPTAPSSRSWLLGCIALLVVVAGIVAAQRFEASMGPCHTVPALPGAGAEPAMRMTVAHNAACAIGARIQTIAGNEVKIEVPPQHGTLALRGRSGVTYRPTAEFTGNDFFAFTQRGHSPARDNMSFVRVSVTVK
jgi:hypothetical protein